MTGAEVTLYYATVPADTDPDRLETRLAPWLTEAEIARTRALAYAPVRREQLVARALVRAALSAFRPEAAPRAWCFAEGERGKPRIAAPAGYARLAFNLTHSHGLAACAVTDSIEVGIDVEWRARPGWSPDQAEGYFSARERAWLEARPADARREGFFQLWTLKEAWLKATGAGMSTPLESFTILPDGDPIRIAFGEDPPAPDPAWAFWQALPLPEHPLALCLARPASPGEPVRVRDGGHPLPHGTMPDG